MNQIKYIFIYTALIFCNVHFVAAQKSTNKSAYKKTFQLGIGIPAITLREQSTSDNSYSGTGLAALSIANTKHKENKFYREFKFNGILNTAKMNIENNSNWNKNATVMNISFLWRRLKPITTKNSWKFYAGIGFSNSLQLNIIPSANNSLSYHLNWINTSLEGMATRDFSYKKRNFTFTYQASLPIVGLSVRPLSYIGLPPQSTIWEQDGGLLPSQFIKDVKLASLHNNFMFRNDISLDMQIRKNKIRLYYLWMYNANSISDNKLNSVQAATHLAYIFNLNKKRKNEK